MVANNKIVITLIVLAATAAFSTASISTAYQARDTFVGTFYSDGGGVVTIHADGTVESIPGDMFDFPEARDSRRSTPALGVWRLERERVIKVTTLLFLTEQFGDNYDPAGLTVKVSYMAKFVKAAQGVSPGYSFYNVVAEVFLPGQNPVLDQPVATVEGVNGRAYRLIAD